MEAAATAILGLSAIIDPRRADLDRTRAEGHLAGTRLPVADDLGAAVLVSLLVARDLVGHLGIEGLGEQTLGSPRERSHRG